MMDPESEEMLKRRAERVVDEVRMGVSFQAELPGGAPRSRRSAASQDLREAQLAEHGQRPARRVLTASTP